VASWFSCLPSCILCDLQVGVRKSEEDALRAFVNVSLNKLSPDNFAKLSMEMMEHVKENAQTGSMLRIVVTIFFDKALSEPHYASIYAQLCEVMSKNLQPVPDIPYVTACLGTDDLHPRAKF